MSATRSAIELGLPDELDYLAPYVVDDLVRLGRASDGGYVVSRRVVADADALLTCGLALEWSFEEDFARRNPQARIHVYDRDPSPGAILRAFAAAIPNAVRGRTGPPDFGTAIRLPFSYRKLFSRGNRHFRSWIGPEAAADTVSLPAAIQRIQAERLIVKIDIEGAEYPLVKQICEHSDSVIAVVIEFHDTAQRRPEFEQALKDLSADYSLIHAHGCNYEGPGPDNLPNVIELTFVQHRYLTSADRRSCALVEGLDFPNNPRNPEFSMHFGAAA